MTREIFISYSQPDRDCAFELTQHLEGAGLRVWIAPRDVSPGADWATEIINALNAARAVVLVFSAQTNDSPQVRREVERAVHKRLLIVPFRIEDTLPFASLEYFLSAAHWLDAFPPPRQPHYARLCTHLQEFLNGPAPEAALPRAARQPAAAGEIPSVAVLPFANLSSDPEQEYFADGLSEELIHQLANLNGLHVAGRTSSFSFKGKQEDVRVIGERLGVAHVLEGSVRKAGSRLRITAQLINCADGYHLWSQTFDRTLDDIFVIQDDIARTVAQALSVTLRIGQVLMMPGGTQNVEAYELYLRAQGHARFLGTLHLQQAIALYRAALAIDAGFALAWSGLAGGMLYLQIYVPANSDHARRTQVWELEQVIGRALQLAPDLWAGHLTDGWWKCFRLQWHAAERAMQKALELAPASECSPRLYLGALWLMAGRVRDAIPLLESARGLDPLLIGNANVLQGAYTVAGCEAEAEAEYLRSTSLEGDREGLEETALLRAFGRGDPQPLIQAQLHRFLAASGPRLPVMQELVAVLDRPDVAVTLLRQAFANPACQDSTQQFKIAVWAAQFGDVDLALAAAHRAYVDGRSLILSLMWYPAYRRVRQHPRFKELLRDLGLVEYWRRSGHWGDFVRPAGESDFDVSET
ncbi:MAG TPA: TIR domain-containing protein [Steroidobacteraceae bacterium]|nr:TIR domain-containing protein [Steroidobacteraceae bacterium]